MAGFADYRSYQRAYAKVKGKPAAIIPPSGIREGKQLEVRGPSTEPEPERDKTTTTRDTMDLMRAVNGYAFLVCACGLKMKLPPDLATPIVACPKCGRENSVPSAELAAIGTVVAAAAGTEAVPGQALSASQSPAAVTSFEYTRKGTGWESFSCGCGHLLQLSPAFQGSAVTCKHCGKSTVIKE
jgi:heat shock protein HtpX